MVKAQLMKAQLMKARDFSETRSVPTSRAVAAARLAVLSLLVLLVALGVHGHFATPLWDTRSKLRDVAVVAALEAVAIGLIVALCARGRRAPPGQRVAGTLRTALLRVLVAGALALAATSLVLVPRIRLPKTKLRAVPGGFKAPACLACSHRAPPATAGSLHFPFLDVAYGLAMALALAAIVVVSVWAARQGHQQLPLEPEAPAEEYGELLEEAVKGGRRALLGLDDARTAIIACYVAMEESLARAGTSRSSAETPDELLAKAASTLLVSAGAARRLTSLFYEARFSTHPLDDNHRAEAETALAELASQLDRAEPAQAGAGP